MFSFFSNLFNIIRESSMATQIITATAVVGSVGAITTGAVLGTVNYIDSQNASQSSSSVVAEFSAISNNQNRNIPATGNRNNSSRISSSSSSSSSITVPDITLDSGTTPIIAY
jgi:hypothetical protein